MCVCVCIYLFIPINLSNTYIVSVLFINLSYKSENNKTGFLKIENITDLFKSQRYYQTAFLRVPRGWTSTASVAHGIQGVPVL